MAEDAGLMRGAAQQMMQHYERIAAPVFLMAGSADEIVDPRHHTAGLHRMIPGSAVRLVPGVGHMVHHIRPDEIFRALDILAGERQALARVQLGGSASISR
jgi:pimeloyl-ACP methyl ester carboxylesterase